MFRIDDGLPFDSRLPRDQCTTEIARPTTPTRVVRMVSVLNADGDADVSSSPGFLRLVPFSSVARIGNCAVDRRTASDRTEAESLCRPHGGTARCSAATRQYGTDRGSTAKLG